MSGIPIPRVDNSTFFYDSSDKFGCQDPSLCYLNPPRCAIPQPVLNSERPLFSYHTGSDSATSGPDGPPPQPDIISQGPLRADLERLSARPYAVRASDPDDFAHVWERVIMPKMLEILQAHCDCDFSVDVQNFPELSSAGDPVPPRVIYVTLPVAAPPQLQELVRKELAGQVPPRFRRTHLKFRQGSVRNTNWWGADDKHLDPVCEPRNTGFQPVPTIGMSVGPDCCRDAGSVGGFVKVEGGIYGLSARHVFEKAVNDGDLRVVHPANGDHRINQSADPHSRQSRMGALFRWSKKDATRVSTTFDGHGVSEHNRVAMDWCLFGPVPEGRNLLAVPCFEMNRLVAIEKSATVEGNTEVYALARTSGYSLGFTSDVPGVQRLERVLRREWTVRQYSPSRFDPSTHLEPPWQSIKSWVTSGIGVQGDSGAWLMRRSDNAVVGLIWARNHNHGTPIERVRLTYITPIVDILADIKEKVQGDVVLPSYSEAEVRYDLSNRPRRRGLGVGHSGEPWSHLSMEELCRRRSQEEAAISTGIVDGEFRTFPSETVASRSPTEEADFLGSYASTSVQVLADTSDVSVSPSSRIGARQREMALLGVGADARFQLGRSDWTRPPSLVIDLGSDSCGSSVTVDELDSLSSNGSVRVAVQDGSEDDRDFANVEDPIRSKATFHHVDVERKSLITRAVKH